MTSALGCRLRRYRLQYRPVRPVVRPASAYNFPLSTPRDYAHISEYQPDDPERAPVILDHGQYFEFLSRLVGELRQALGERTRVFIELRMPSVGPLPDGLLRPGILMGAYLQEEATFWAEHGDAPVVWIGDRIRRDLDHAADNSLTVATWPDGPTAHAVIARGWPEHAIEIVPIGELFILPNEKAEMVMDTETNQPDGLRWTMPVDAFMSDDYACREEKLNKLYDKAKGAQWDVAKDVDWRSELDPDNPLGMPDPMLLIYGTSLWDGLDAKGRKEVRHHWQGWMLSQILHGEQAALICASKLASAEDSLSARLCAAMQVADEARHVEAYSRLVSDKLTVKYPMSHSLKGLLEDTITSRALDITNLGMQVLVEGIALSIFQSIVAYSKDPFIKDLFTRIHRDEARHFAVGRITLSRIYSEMTSTELKEREEFVSEGAHVLFEHLCADDIWEPMGFAKDACGALVRQSKVANGIRRAIFRRLVPTIRELGLLTPRVRRTFEKLDVIDYERMPLA